mgnify:CR=1 FL=1
MRRFPKIGERVEIKGYSALPLEVVAVNKVKVQPIILLHPISGALMDFARNELIEHRRGMR